MKWQSISGVAQDPSKVAAHLNAHIYRSRNIAIWGVSDPIGELFNFADDYDMEVLEDLMVRADLLRRCEGEQAEVPSYPHYECVPRDQICGCCGTPFEKLYSEVLS